MSEGTLGDPMEAWKARGRELNEIYDALSQVAHECGEGFNPVADLRALGAERDRYRKALEQIRDHGKVEGHECWALHQGDCADVFQEIARATLERLEQARA